MHLTLKEEAPAASMNSLQQQCASMPSSRVQRRTTARGSRMSGRTLLGSLRPTAAVLACLLHDRDIPVAAQPHLPASQEDQHPSCWQAKASASRSRRRYLAQKLQPLRSRIFRPGAKTLQPLTQDHLHDFGMAFASTSLHSEEMRQLRIAPMCVRGVRAIGSTLLRSAG